ncbi:MAG: hypothetical protein ABSA64_01075 [Sedimentisphaerales bacterium]|jgi:hypothetical protein
MNLLAAATPTQSSPVYQNPAYQNQAYQNTTVQPDRPVAKPSLATKAFVYGYWFFHIAIVIFIIIFMVLMVYRFVKAHEKIANSMDKGIIIKKEDTTT